MAVALKDADFIAKMKLLASAVAGGISAIILYKLIWETEPALQRFIEKRCGFIFH